MSKQFVVLILLGIALPTGAMGGFFGGSSNYDECIIEHMKGQERYMYQRVRKSCERKFEVELEEKHFVSLDWVETRSIILGWDRSTSKEVVVSIKLNDSDFEITRAILVFSRKSCKESKNEDYNIKAEALFSSWLPGGGATIQTDVILDSSKSVKCFKTIEVYGKRIK